jgi:hypothetical protein
MAKQRQCAVPAVAMHLVKPRWQAKSRATLRARLQAHSRVMRRALLQANSRVKTADPPSPGLRRASWRPPLLGLPVKVKLLVMAADSPSAPSQQLRRVGWVPQLLEPQD